MIKGNQTYNVNMTVTLKLSSPLYKVSLTSLVSIICYNFMLSSRFMCDSDDQTIERTQKLDPQIKEQVKQEAHLNSQVRQFTFLCQIISLYVDATL